MNKLLIIALTLITCGCTIPFLTEDQPYKLRVSWLGHAGYLLETTTSRVYINPYTVPVGALKADGILVSYSGADLCDVDNIQTLSKEDSSIISPPECSARLAMPNLIPMKANSTYNVGEFEIRTVPAYNINGTITKGEGFGLIITVNNTKLYYVGVSDIIPEMNNLRTTNFDVIMFPIAGGDLTMDLNESITFMKMMRSIHYLPMYYGGNTGTSLDVGRLLKSTATEQGLNVTLLSNEDLFIR